LTVDKKGLRPLVDLVQSRNLMARIEKGGQRNVVVFVELVDLRPIVIDADRKHLEFPVFERLIESLHFRHFCNTRRTPCAPEIQKYNFAAEIAQLDEFAVPIFDREIRRLLADIDDSRITDVRRFPVDEETGHKTHDHKENDGFEALAHNSIILSL